MADLTAYTCLFLFLVAAASLRKGLRRRLVASLVAVVVVVGVFLSYYAVNIQSRIGLDAAKAASSNSQDAGSSGGEVSKDSAPAPSSKAVAKQLDHQAALGVATEREGNLVYTLPGGLRASTLILSSYITHAYRGLSIALGESWTPTWGLGFSGFLRHNIAKTVGGDKFEASVESETYAGKITAKGWPVGQVWSTFFIDPASDISFPGVILLMGAIGFFFAKAWRETITKGDPLAAGVFYYLCLLVFYLPANNQLFQGGETAIGFSVLFIMWLLHRAGALNRAIETLKLQVSASTSSTVSSTNPLTSTRTIS